MFKEDKKLGKVAFFSTRFYNLTSSINQDNEYNGMFAFPGVDLNLGEVIVRWPITEAGKSPG
ncbi:MAG: hypothetical protein RJR37_01485 [Peptococcaceae bacterium MAG4]|nr:hypothetical protein [Peptococcaceae bacterium MAG4]